jgi:hypothetical protein
VLLRQSWPVLLPTIFYRSSSVRRQDTPLRPTQSGALLAKWQGSSVLTSLATAATLASTRLKARLPGDYFWCQLLRTPFGRSSVGPGPMGGDFSGSSDVTTRNILLHDGATNATWSGRFDAEGVAICPCKVLTAVQGGSLATANFREFLFHALG